jgi:hypothetical protein
MTAEIDWQDPTLPRLPAKHLELGSLWLAASHEGDASTKQLATLAMYGQLVDGSTSISWRGGLPGYPVVEAVDGQDAAVRLCRRILAGYVKRTVRA